MPICASNLSFKKRNSYEWIKVPNDVSLFKENTTGECRVSFTVRNFTEATTDFFSRDLHECHGCNPFLKIFC